MLVLWALAITFGTNILTVVWVELIMIAHVGVQHFEWHNSLVIHSSQLQRSLGLTRPERRVWSVPIVYWYRAYRLPPTPCMALSPTTSGVLLMCRNGREHNIGGKHVRAALTEWKRFRV